MTCPLCHPSKNIVLRSDHWTVVVNDDQGYLGRCYFALNRHETDVTKLLSDEHTELWKLFTKVKFALDTLWQPDHYNYVFLMNVEPHLHGHIIPRYAADRMFDGLTFVDSKIGKHYDLNNINIPKGEMLAKIADEIARHISLQTECTQ